MFNYLILGDVFALLEEPAPKVRLNDVFNFFLKVKTIYSAQNIDISKVKNDDTNHTLVTE